MNALNGEWIDEMGACRVCGGEIPHGHSENCDYYKATKERDEWRECAESAAKALDEARFMIETVMPVFGYGVVHKGSPKELIDSAIDGIAKLQAKHPQQ